MGWELVKDGKRYKCWLNLDEVEIYVGKGHDGHKDWGKSIDKKIGARYQWMNDEMEERWFIIKNYANRYLILVDKNNNEFKINSSSLCKGALGKIFDKHTDKFRYNIGDTVNDLVIINREYRKDKRNTNIKWYQYQCIKCGNIDWIYEGGLKKRQGCNICCLYPQKVLKGYNDIATTHPHLCPYFVNQEDVYKYTAGSNEKVLLKCPDCGYQKEMRINTLHRYGFGCNKCSDGTSYPEKFMVNILSQLNIKFITQLNHTTFVWCDKYFYDFYLPDFNIIIETHGLQHYRNAFQTYKETHENDLIKYDIAVLNSFEANRNYFVVDSRESTLDWMKEHIIETLGHLFDFSNVDWEKADLECQKSHMILACQLKKENPNLSTKEITELIKKEIGIEYGHDTISSWLNRGNKLGLCHYNGKEEQKKGNKKMRGKNSPNAKKVKQKDLNGNIIKIWDYVKQISEELGYSYSTLMLHLSGAQKGKLYKGYIWEYYE